MIYIGYDSSVSTGSVDESGVSSALNIAAPGVVLKNAPGRLGTVNVLVAGAVGGVYDCATLGAAAAANQIMVIQAVVGQFKMDWPCKLGIVVIPGAAQVVSASYG
jgi:hypothetical protein